MRTKAKPKLVMTYIRTLGKNLGVKGSQPVYGGAFIHSPIDRIIRQIV